MKLLIVEDERELSRAIMLHLDAVGFVCESAHTVAAAQEKLAAYDYDAVVLDLNLPDGNGLRLLETIKRDHVRAGVLIISARNAVDDRVKGLELGADDYLTKPFHLTELTARVQAIIRRRAFHGEQVIHAGVLSVEPAAHQARVGNALLNLSRKEFDLLLFMMVNKGRVLTKAAIAEHLWGDHMDAADNFDLVYSHMKNLRKKIAEVGGADPVRTVYGVGYSFHAE